MIRFVWEGYYLDGRTAQKRPAAVELTHSGLRIRAEGIDELAWPYHEIRQTQGFYAMEPVRIEHGDAAPEILIIEDHDFLTSLHEISPGSTRHFHNPDRRGLRVRLTIYAALGVVAAGAGVYLWGIPFLAALIAPHVPMEWEEGLGRSTLSVLAPDAMRCTDRELTAAVDGITSVLTARESESYPFKVYVVRSPVVNALALPGGSIVLYRGLIEQTGSPEELAGVIAHEIQHITKRHATKRIIEDSATGLMISAVTGDVTGAVVYGAKAAHTLARLRYSRRDEDEADREGMRMLITAGIDPGGMVRFFENMKDRDSMPGILQYASTHPDTNQRIARLKRLAAESGGYRTLPGSGDWDRIRNGCAGE